MGKILDYTAHSFHLLAHYKDITLYALGNKSSLKNKQLKQLYFKSNVNIPHK